MMPAAKHGDTQMGVDLHLCTVPPAGPVPLPTPHMSVVFDPFDYVPVIGATITVCGMKRATAGTAGTVVHIPPGFPFAPKLPEKDDEIFMGSATIVADGDPMSHISHPVLSCQVAGMSSPTRPKKKGGPRMMVLPTVFNLAIPTTVFLGGPPTISLMGMAFKAGFAALGKLAKSKAFKRFRQKVFKDMKPGFLKCKVLRAEPVNILSGEVVVEQEDFLLPGRIPLQWLRSYGSSSAYTGLLGPGWETPADIRLELDAGGAVQLQGPGVGPLQFERLPVALGEASAELELMDGARLSDHGDEYRVWTKDDRVYRFPKALGHAVDEPLLPGMSAGERVQRRWPIGQIGDRCGNAWSFEYQGTRAVAINESAGRRIVLARGPGATAGAGPERLQAVTLYDPATRTEHTFVRYEYDEPGRLVAVVDALGAPYRYTYGSGVTERHMVRHTDRNGLSFHYAFEPAPDGSQRVVHAWGDGGLYDYRFEYLDAVNERRITDSLGHVSTVKLSEAGLPISELDPLGGMTIFEYDDAGRTTAVVDPAGRRTETHYDEAGNLLRLVRPDGTAVATEYEQHKPVLITDPNGAQWRQRWDPRGLLVEQTSPLGYVTRYEYDAAGQLAAAVNPRGARTQLRFDAYANLTALTDALGHATQFAHDALGNIVARGDALDRRTLYRYDAKGRLLGVKLPSGATIACAYDPQDYLTHYTDENGAVTRLEYFGQGEIARRIQPDGHVVEYLYDTEERLIGVRNQRGELHQLRRDALGRVVEEIDYWGQSRRYAYDAGGSLLASLDPLNRRVDYRCDPLGRVVAKVFADPSGAPEPLEETFAYDGNGRLVGMANRHVQVARRFDLDGRIVAEEQVHASGESFVVESTYDETGNRTRRTTTSSAGSGRTVEYAYDLLGHCIGLRVDGGEPVRLQRNALGHVTHEQLGPRLSRTVGYNPDGLIERQSVAAGGSELFSIRYDYDRAGNLLGRHDSEQGSDTFVYDPLGRILQHTDPQGVLNKLFHDPAGDRFSTQVHGQGVQAGPAGSNAGDDWHREGRHDGVRYRFDRAGNLVLRHDGAQRLDLAWDAQQRLVASRRTGRDGAPVTTTYAYDPLGRRLYKETAGQRTWFGWDGNAMAFDCTPAEWREFVYRPGSFEPFAMLAGNAAGGIAPGALLYVNDPNGCPTRLVDQDGRTAWSAHYGVWGGVVKLHAQSVDNPLRLQGQYADAETGLHYNRHRYYSPDSGSYVSADPLGMAAGENTYALGPNVFEWADPLGLNCEVTQKLQRYANEAAQEAKLSPKQQASIQRSLNRAAAATDPKLIAHHQMMAAKKERLYMGTQIDTIFKSKVDGDLDLKRAGIVTTPRGTFGPDVVDAKNERYWDLTTESDWAKGTHQAKYDDDFGSGTGVIW